MWKRGGDWTHERTNYHAVLQGPGNGNRFMFLFAGGGRGVPAPLDFAWHHYAVVAVNGAADPTFYVDNVAQTIDSTFGPATMTLYPSTAPLNIGARRWIPLSVAKRCGTTGATLPLTS